MLVRKFARITNTSLERWILACCWSFANLYGWASNRFEFLASEQFSLLTLALRKLLWIFLQFQSASIVRSISEEAVNLASVTSNPAVFAQTKANNNMFKPEVHNTRMMGHLEKEALTKKRETRCPFSQPGF